jgi:hypothetical protein
MALPELPSVPKLPSFQSERMAGRKAVHNAFDSLQLLCVDSAKEIERRPFFETTLQHCRVWGFHLWQFLHLWQFWQCLHPTLISIARLDSSLLGGYLSAATANAVSSAMSGGSNL